MQKIIYIGSDHAGFDYKIALVNYLKTQNYGVEDLGTFNADSCDYPDYAHRVAAAVDHNLGTGILICGSGNGHGDDG